MKRNRLAIISLVFIILISLLLIGITYGFYLTKIKGNKSAKSVEIVLGETKVEFSDLSTDDTSRIVKPGYTEIKVFTVKNIGNIEADYSIYLVDLYNDLKRTQDLTYNLYKIKGEVTEVNENTDFSSWIRINETENLMFPKKSGVIANEIIENPNDIYTYVLKIVYINDPNINQNEDQGSSFEYTINLRADDKDINVFAEGTLAYNILKNAIDNKNGTSYKETPLTIPAKELSKFIYVKGEESTSTTELDVTDYYISYADDYSINEETGLYTLNNPTTIKYSNEITSSLIENKYAFWNIDESVASNLSDISTLYKISSIDTTNNILTYKTISKGYESTENILSVTQDRYGDSYYFRGGVKDNYVLFNNICWRVVRIEGDASVKLLYLGEVDANATSCENITSSTIITSGGLGSIAYKYTYTTLVKNNITYNLAPYGEYHMSSGKILKEWYNAKFTTNSDKLKEDVWCTGDSLNTRYRLSGTNKGQLLEQDIYPSNGWWYAAGNRALNTKIADITCPDSEGVYVSKIGSLAYDEVVFAGGIYNTINNTYYIKDNTETNKKGYWLLTQAYNNKYPQVFQMNIDGKIVIDKAGADGINLMRPAITLKRSTKLTSGDGTKSNPYIIG